MLNKTETKFLFYSILFENPEILTLMQDNDNDSQDIKFSISDKYKSSYLQDAYEAEEYHAKKNLIEGVQNALVKFIENNPQYDELRHIDISMLKVGDHIKLIPEAEEKKSKKKKPVIIGEIIGENQYKFRISIHKKFFTEKYKTSWLWNEDDKMEENDNHKYVWVGKHCIESMNNPIVRLKAHDISFLYNGIRKYFNDLPSGEMEFFDVFTDYFKINPKICYQSLPVNIRSELIKELQERTNILDKKGRVPLW